MSAGYSERIKVVIIGAGMAGLSAAEFLHSNGFDSWRILEGSERCGGRIKTTNFGSSFVEEGANWIHGACLSNSAYFYGIQHKLIFYPPTLWNREFGQYYNTKGLVINSDLSQKMYKFFKTIEEKTGVIDEKNDISMRNLVEKEYEEFREELDEIETQDGKSLLNYILNFLAKYSGDDAELISASGYGTYEDLPGEDVIIPGGYSSFVYKLLSTIPEENVLLNHNVVNVNWNCDPCTVECSNGERFLADYVLVTLPLGILKHQGRQLFTPTLPTKKLKAIDEIGFGRVCKIFLEFYEPFWQPGSLNIINLAWRDEDIEDYKHREDFWVTKLVAIEEVPNNTNVLYAWLGGSVSPQVEALPEGHVKDAIAKVLRVFLGNPTVPAPNNVMMSKWCSDVWTRGAYSFSSLKSGAGGFGDLAEPVLYNDRMKLLFAGEATHPYFFSTVHGARCSGVREAERVLSIETH